ncbi:MAG: hypothetical protein M3137_01360, partial [Actinomycetota bacterium]|nr:hypothetical protein [Actinomycetota bacterium]
VENGHGSVAVSPGKRAPTGKGTEIRPPGEGLSQTLLAISDEITEALALSDQAIRRVEQLTAALSVEVAEVGQAISDQVGQYSEAATDQVRDGLGSLRGQVGMINKSMSDSLATITQQLDGLSAAVAESYDRPVGSSAEGMDDLVEGTAEAVTRIETLVEALVEASDARPADISELSVRTLERLGLTVGARFEANTTTAVEAIDAAVNQAIDRVTEQFKDMAPPVVDRSTTSAITRLEERVAALTRQRDEHDRETKVTLNGLEETVGRLASAQAEDLERILDSIEGASLPAPANDNGEEDHLARIEASLSDLAGGPAVPEDLVGVIAEQFDAVNKHLAALRRRLPLRARTTTAGLDEGSFDALAAAIAQHLQDGAGAAPAESPRAARTPHQAARATKAVSSRKPGRPAKAAPSVRTTPAEARYRPFTE